MANAVFRQEQGVTVVELAGRIDATSVESVRTAIWSQLGEVPRLVIDAGKVDYLSSAGLRLFVSLSRHVASLKGRLVLTHFTKAVEEVLTLSGLKQYLPTAATVAEGIRKIQRPA